MRARRGKVAGVALASVVIGCTGTHEHARRVDRSIRTGIDQQALPQAPHSGLGPVPDAVRVRVLDDAVAVDDLALWTKLSDEQRRALTSERPKGWTHVPPTPLETDDGEGPPTSAVLLSAMARAREGARAVHELLGDADEGFALFADADASFHTIVRVLHSAWRSELGTAHLVARRDDGTLGSFSPYLPRLCEDDEPRPRPHARGEACFELTVAVVGDSLVVRGQPSHQPLGDCLWIAKADSRPEGGSTALHLGSAMSGDSIASGLGRPETAEESSEHPAPAASAGPCGELPMLEASRSRRGLAEIADPLAGVLPFCTQARLTASADARWGDVVTAYDRLRVLGPERIQLEAGVPASRCE